MKQIVDIGPDSVTLIAPHIERANFILWNGPTGIYEEGFVSYTHAIAEIISRRVAAVRMPSSVAAIRSRPRGSGIKEEDLGFLSTGGGACWNTW